MSIFLIFNHKFPFNTKINDLENNKVKPIFNYEMVLMNGLWIGRIWINVKNGEGKGGWKYDISESQHTPQLNLLHVLMQLCMDVLKKFWHLNFGFE